MKSAYITMNGITRGPFPVIEGVTYSRALDKLARCISLARECNHDYIATKDKRYKQIRIESMEDARYWRDVIASNK